jgi:titin
MVDSWGSWVTNFGSKRIRIGATIVPYVFSDRIDFYLGIDLQSEYAINDNSNRFSISGNWSRSATSTDVSIGSGGGTEVLWSEAVSSGHLYRVSGSPGQTLTASVSSYIENLFEDNKRASVSYSESARIPAVAPTAPTASSTPYNGGITVTYGAPSYDGGSAISFYQKSTDNVNWTGSVVSPIGNPFNESGTNGTALTVYVRAVNSDNLAGPSVSTTSTPRTTPGAPTSFAASNATFGQLDLSWAAPSSNGGASVSGYTLTRTSPGTATTLLTNANQTTYTDSSLLPYADYTYTVAAVNVAGTGSTATVTQKTMGGVAKVWNGTTWVTTLPKIWNGTTWLDAQARMWDGTEWKHGI